MGLQDTKRITFQFEHIDIKWILRIIFKKIILILELWKHKLVDSSSFQIWPKFILELKYSYFCLYFAWEGERKKALGGGTKCFHIEAMASPFVPRVPKHVLKTLEVLQSHQGKYCSLDSSFFQICEKSASQWFHGATKP